MVFAKDGLYYLFVSILALRDVMKIIRQTGRRSTRYRWFNCLLGLARSPDHKHRKTSFKPGDGGANETGR